MPEIAVSRKGIFAAFERLVARKGLDAVTMNDVADEAGISVGSIYRHFDGKDALIAAIEEKWQRHVAVRNATILESERPAREKIHDILVRHVDMFGTLIRENQAVRELLVGAIRLRYVGRTLEDTREAVFRHMRQGVAVALEQGVREGDFAVADPDRTARLFVEAFRGFFSPPEVVGRDHREVLADAEAMFALLMRSVETR